MWGNDLPMEVHLAAVQREMVIAEWAQPGLPKAETWMSMTTSSETSSHLAFSRKPPLDFAGMCLPGSDKT